MVKFGWSPPVYWFLSLSLPLPSLWGLFQVHQLQLVSPTPSYSIFSCSLARSMYLSIFSLSFIFTLCFARRAKSTIRQVHFFNFIFVFLFSFLSILFIYLVITGSGCLIGIRGSVCISKSYRILCPSFYKHIIILLLWEFFIPALADGFPPSLNDSKFPLVSRTFLSILADLNNSVV